MRYNIPTNTDPEPIRIHFQIQVTMGEFYALLCALLWAFAVILFRKSGETIAPFALNLFRVVVGSGLLTITLYVTGGRLDQGGSWRDVLILCGSGVLAIAVADTMFHKCLNAVGAGITAIVDCLYSPLVVIFAFFMLGETLGVKQLLGMALVVGGVLIATIHKSDQVINRWSMIRGVLWGTGAMTALSLGIVIAKPVLEHTPVLWATTVRQLGAMAALVPIAMLSPQRRQYVGVFKPRLNWRYSLSGAIVGSYLSLIFWIAGMKYTLAGAAAILNQTSSIYVLVLATIFLKESFTKRKLAALLAALAGILLVTMN
jgi:drug/metabolite transporter (DMT)-like permease